MATAQAFSDGAHGAHQPFWVLCQLDLVEDAIAANTLQGRWNEANSTGSLAHPQRLKPSNELIGRDVAGAHAEDGAQDLRKEREHLEVARLRLDPRCQRGVGKVGHPFNDDVANAPVGRVAWRAERDSDVLNNGLVWVAGTTCRPDVREGALPPDALDVVYRMHHSNSPGRINAGSTDQEVRVPDVVGRSA